MIISALDQAPITLLLNTSWGGTQSRYYSNGAGDPLGRSVFELLCSRISRISHWPSSPLCLCKLLLLSFFLASAPHLRLYRYSPINSSIASISYPPRQKPQAGIQTSSWLCKGCSEMQPLRTSHPLPIFPFLSLTPCLCQASCLHSCLLYAHFPKLP